MRENNKISVLFTPSDSFGVGHFRSIDPAKAIQKYYGDEFDVEINQFPNLEDIEYLKKFDIIHFHRGLGPKENEDANFARIKSLGIKLVTDLDDWHSPFSGHPMRDLIIREKLPEKIISTLKKVDYITTTTSIFKEEIQKINPTAKVFVISNAINRDDRMWKENDTRKKDEKGNIIDNRTRISWIGGSCYDDQTEILTENGFKLFKDLEPQEKVACLNVETNKTEFHEPLGYIKEEYKGEVYCADKNMLNFVVTPNHNMYVSEVKNLSTKILDFKLNSAENVYGKDLHFKKDIDWDGEKKEFMIIPAFKDSSLEKYQEDLKLPMDLWLKFFGFWMAEGWTSKTTKLYQTGVCQIKDNGILEEMYKTLCEFGLNPTYTKDGNQIRVFDKRIWNYLKQFGYSYEKFIPKEIKGLCKEQLEIFLKYFAIGDGCEEKSGRIRLFTSSKQLANDLNEITLKLGTVSSVKNRGMRKNTIKKIRGREIFQKHDAFVVSMGASGVRNRKTPLLRKEDIFKKNYEGFIYCVNVPGNVIYIRRNGKGMWCGNSHLLDLKLMENSFNLLHSNEELKDKYQTILSGFDVRGIITQINEDGTQKQLKMEPHQSIWYEFEKILSANYKAIQDDPEYIKWLKNYKTGEYPNVLSKTYVRRNTLPLTKYATHYDYIDVALAPLDEFDIVTKPNGQIVKQPNIFNKVKSELKIIEAGMKKKALIAQDFGIYKELLNHEDTALLVSKNDKGWYQAMRRLILEPELREKLANNLHNFVKDKYDIKNVTKDRVEIYKQILNDQILEDKKEEFILQPIVK